MPPLLALLALRGLVFDRFLAQLAGPLDLAALLVDLQQLQLLVVGLGGDEDGVVPDGRRAVAPLRQRTFPDDARGGIPRDREMRFAA